MRWRLDALATEYLRLCQQYPTSFTSFCAEAQPDKSAEPCCERPRSQRWQRVAIQRVAIEHAAGIAESWRSNPSTLTPSKTPWTRWSKTRSRRKASAVPLQHGRNGPRQSSKRR
jgi:hypothetical protein